MSREPGTDNEKQKADVTWTDSYLLGKKSDFIFGNALYHNLGDGKIEEVSDKMGVEITGHGASAWAISTPTDGTTFSSPRA